MELAAAKAGRGSARSDGFTARLAAPDRAPTRLPSLLHWLTILTQVRYAFREAFGLTVRGPRRNHCSLHVTGECGLDMICFGSEGTHMSATDPLLAPMHGAE